MVALVDAVKHCKCTASFWEDGTCCTCILCARHSSYAPRLLQRTPCHISLSWDLGPQERSTGSTLSYIPGKQIHTVVLQRDLFLLNKPLCRSIASRERADYGNEYSTLLPYAEPATIGSLDCSGRAGAPIEWTICSQYSPRLAGLARTRTAIYRLL